MQEGGAMGDRRGWGGVTFACEALRRVLNLAERQGQARGRYLCLPWPTSCCNLNTSSLQSVYALSGFWWPAPPGIWEPTVTPICKRNS
jgi:hypothetical protein